MSCNVEYLDFDAHIQSIEHRQAHYLDNPFMKQIDSLCSQLSLKNIENEESDNTTSDKIDMYHMKKLCHLDFLIKKSNETVKLDFTAPSKHQQVLRTPFGKSK